MSMSINQISPHSLQAPTFSESPPSLVTGDLVDLDTRLAEEVSRLAAGTQVEKERITTALNNPAVTSDPEQLAIWQNRLSAYTIDTSLYSTLARKGVSAIETLIKT